jgi:hypothetical protein
LLQILVGGAPTCSRPGAGDLKGELKEVCDERGLRLHVATIDVVNLPLPDHRHCFVAGQRSSGGWQTSKAEPRPHQSLYSSMILLDNVVEVFALSQPRETPQLTFTLHLCGGTRVGRVLVDGDRTRIASTKRIASTNLCQCLAKETLG